MPLPDRGPWPPQHLHGVYERMAVWSAWYAGDPDQLSAIYGGDLAATPFTTTIPDTRLLGGFRARVRALVHRWFWGTSTPPHERRTKLHVPVAGDIAATSADLLFSEPPAFTVDEATTQARLDELTGEGLYVTLLEAAEVAAALGGVYLRTVWDRQVADRPWISPVHADAALPEWRWGRMTAVTFWRVVADDGTTVLRHLERHEPGAILHGLYQGDRHDLGRRIPLTEHPELTGLADALSDGDAIPTGLPGRLTAVYIPNVRPARCWRNTPAATHLGRSDYAGAEGLLDALDETYSSWLRDIRLAKARLVVPDSYLHHLGPGRGARFDPEQEVYAGINALTGPDQPAPSITPVQFGIRVTEHRETARELLVAILRQAGYSAQTFGEYADAAVTATEVTARERRSFVTRNKKITYWRPALQDITETLLMLDAAVFGSGVEPQRPTVEFGDSIAEDPKRLAETADLLNRAEAASTDTKIRLIHPDWDDTQVANEVQQILAETGRLVPDPATVGAPPEFTDAAVS